MYQATRTHPGALRRCCSRRWLAAGCGASGRRLERPAHPDYARALAGSPPPLAALHEQAERAAAGRHRGLRSSGSRRCSGYPVVANVWASWCGPCRFEFPTLQKLSARYGKRVAFLGVNSEDSEDAGQDLPRARRRSPTRATPTPTKRDRPQPRRRRRPPRHRLLRPRGRSSSTSSRAPTRTTPNWKKTSALRAGKRIIGAMDAFVVIALVAVGLLLAELLLPTGGVLGAIGVARPLRRRDRRPRRRRQRPPTGVGGALIALGVVSGDHLLLRRPQGLRRPPRPAGAQRHRGDDRGERRGADRDRRRRRPGLHPRHALGGPAGRRVRSRSRRAIGWSSRRSTG